MGEVEIPDKSECLHIPNFASEISDLLPWRLITWALDSAPFLLAVLSFSFRVSDCFLYGPSLYYFQLDSIQ